MSKYDRRIRGKDGVITTVDVYDVLHAFGVSCPASAHAIKKLLAPGQRGHKNALQDLAEARDSVARAIQLQEPMAPVAARMVQVFDGVTTLAQAEQLARYQGKACPQCGDEFPPNLGFCHNVDCVLSVVKRADETDAEANARKDPSQWGSREIAQHVAAAEADICPRCDMRVTDCNCPKG